ncbi:Protein CLEC-51 [Aphelenchoides avenae]|nr:Protein CLEC-51 [Aphelenchus avenae]
MLVLSVFAAIISYVFSQCNDDGWAHLDSTDRCYKLMTGLDTWLNYEAKCQSEDGHLTSVTSWQELQFLAELSATGLSQPDCNSFYCPNAIWIGYSANPRQAFQWADGSNANYTNWPLYRPQMPDTQRTFAAFYPDHFANPMTETTYQNFKWDHYPRNDVPYMLYARGAICKK